MGITQQIGASSLIKPGVIDNTAARPASPFEGQVIFQKDTDQLLVWNGTAWVIPNSPAQNPQALELVKTQTIGTTVATVDITDCFSSTYDNYRITVSSDSSSTNTSIGIRLGASTTGYYGYLNYGAYNSATALGVHRDNASQHNWAGGNSTTGQPMIAILDIINPNKASYTHFGPSAYREGLNYGTMQGEHRVATAYTGFTVLMGSGTMTGGTIRVYGYRNS